MTEIGKARQSGSYPWRAICSSSLWLFISPAWVGTVRARAVHLPTAFPVEGSQEPCQLWITSVLQERKQLRSLWRRGMRTRSVISGNNTLQGPRKSQHGLEWSTALSLLCPGQTGICQRHQKRKLWPLFLYVPSIPKPGTQGSFLWEVPWVWDNGE